MKKLLFSLLFGLLFLLSSPNNILSGSNDGYLVKFDSRKLGHKLHYQPNGGPFAVLLVTGSAYGSDISVVNIEPAAGPGQIKGIKIWSNWQTYNRIWQENKWCSDIVNFAWSPSLKYLYVATSDIYGDGGFFELDLVNRKATRILPDEKAPYYKNLQDVEHYTSIESIDVPKRSLKVNISKLTQSGSEVVATETVTMK